MRAASSRALVLETRRFPDDDSRAGYQNPGEGHAGDLPTCASVLTVSDGPQNRYATNLLLLSKHLSCQECFSLQKCSVASPLPFNYHERCRFLMNPNRLLRILFVFGLLDGCVTRHHSLITT